MQRNDWSGTATVDGLAGFVSARTFGENGLNTAFNARVNNRYVYPWIVMGTTFIPVIPTYSANLAGTASFTAQWYIGQGMEAFGFSGLGSNFLHWSGTNNLWDQELGKRFGGYVQAQYYFNNQWFMNAAYAMSRAFGVSPGETNRFRLLRTIRFMRLLQTP